MADARRIIELVTGAKPSPAQIQRITGIAAAAEIAPTDPMFPVLVAMDAEHGVLARISVRVLDAQKLEREAAERAEKIVEALGKASVAADVEAAVAQARFDGFLAGGFLTGAAFALGVFSGFGVLWWANTQPGLDTGIVMTRIGGLSAVGIIGAGAWARVWARERDGSRARKAIIITTICVIIAVLATIGPYIGSSRPQ